MTYFHIRVSAGLYIDKKQIDYWKQHGKFEVLSDQERLYRAYDNDHGFNPLFEHFCNNHLTRYIMVLENADAEEKRPHIHIHGQSAIHGNSQSIRRAWVKAHLPTGRGSYSCKSHDNSVKPPNERGYVYVCKGPEAFVKKEPDVRGKLGFSDEDILQLHEEYWANNKIYQESLRPEPIVESIKVDLSDEPIVKKRPKTITWTQQLICDINAVYPDKTWSLQLETDKTKLCDLILDKMGQGGKALDKVVFRRIFYSVYNGVRKTNQDKTMFRQGFYDCIEEM